MFTHLSNKVKSKSRENKQTPLLLCFLPLNFQKNYNSLWSNKSAKLATGFQESNLQEVSIYNRGFEIQSEYTNDKIQWKGDILSLLCADRRTHLCSSLRSETSKIGIYFQRLVFATTLAMFYTSTFTDNYSGPIPQP